MPLNIINIQLDVENLIINKTNSFISKIKAK